MPGLIGRVGSLLQKLPAANKLFQGFGGIEKTSLGLGGLLYGADLIRQQTDRLGITPSDKQLGLMQEARSKIGKNYTIGGVEYDFRTGRPVNPPPSVFPPVRNEEPRARQWSSPEQSLFSGFQSNGAGVPAQRQDVQERALSQEVLNAAQQYAAPAGVPLSSFYEGQQQLGRSSLKDGTLLRQLQDLGGVRGMTPETLTQWAQANPGLAYRELLRLKGRPL